MGECFAIGDVHGHLDRLQSLLMQEGLIASRDGMVQRTHPEVEIISLGDLGHFGANQDGSPKSPTADLLSYSYGQQWLDLILWGNHDRYLVDDVHAFGGCAKPSFAVMHIIRSLMSEGRMPLALERHGFLLTHAGLSKSFMYQKNVDPEIKYNPKLFADWINEGADPRAIVSDAQMTVRDAISGRRGGWANAGGILWRDINEKLYPSFRQVFGHSAGKEVRYCDDASFTYDRELAPKDPSYCIDIGSADNGRLAGIYLPSERIATI